MRIVHIIYDSIGNPWLGGGGAERTQAIYSRLRSDNDVTVLCGNYPNAISNREGVKYRHIGWGRSYLLSRLTFLILLPLYAIFTKADLTIEDIGMPGPLIWPLIKRKIWASVQFIPDETYIANHGVLGRLVRQYFRVGIRAYPRIITVSSATAELLRRINIHAKITIIPNGINLPVNIHKGQPEKPYMLFLGRIDIHQKGIDTLVSALKQVKNMGSISLVIAGNGTSREVSRLRELLASGQREVPISYFGWANNDDKTRLISNCLFLVLPSRAETFGIVALEGLSYGKPVIGTRVGGMKEVLESSQGAMVVEPNDPLALAEAIKKLSTDSSLRQDMGLRGAKYAQLYTWDKIAKKFRLTMLDMPHSSAETVK